MALTSVRAAITSNTQALSGTFAHEGITLAAGDDVLVARSTPSADSGFYDVQSGAWTRHADYDADAEFVPGMSVFVREGNVNGGRNYQFKNPTTPTVGSTLLNFKPTDFPKALVPATGSGLAIDPATGEISRATYSGVGGSYSNPLLDINDLGDVTEVISDDLQSTFITGLEVSWPSANTLQVEAGAAWVPGKNKVVVLPSAAVISGLNFTSGSWHYVYLWEDVAGAPQIEISLTAPGGPYLGWARTKSGDTTRRYLGEGRAYTVNDIWALRSTPDGWSYWPHPQTAAPRRILNNLAPSSTNVFTSPASAGADVVYWPATARYIWVGCRVQTGANHSGNFCVSGLGDPFAPVVGGTASMNTATIVCDVIPTARRNFAFGMLDIGATERRIIYGFDGAGAELTVLDLSVGGYWSGR